MSREEKIVLMSATETEIRVLWNEYENLLEMKKSIVKKKIDIMRDICGHLE